MLTINTASLTATVAVLRTAATGIGTELSQLETASNALAGAWSGDAQIAYAQAHREWSQSLRELQEILVAASIVAANASTRFEQTEQRITAAWQL